MEYLNKKFTVALGSDAYRENYDQVFGKKPDPVLEKSENYLKYKELEKRLHEVQASPVIAEEEKLQDLMSTLWYKLTPEEQHALNREHELTE